MKANADRAACAATFINRQKHLCNRMQDEGVDAFLVTHLPQIRYLCGFQGSTAFLLVCRSGSSFFFTDFRYQEQVREDLASCPDMEAVIVAGDYWKSIGEKIRALGVVSLAFESKYCTVYQFSEMQKIGSIRLSPWVDVCAKLCAIKSEWEIERIAQAAQITDKLFVRLTQWYAEKTSEKDLAARLEYEGRLLGCDGPAFPSIIASGPNAALPHAQTTFRVPEKNEFIISDFGMRLGGYCSDFTRTVVLGKAASWMSEIYEIVLKAQETALRAVRAGVPCKEVDNAARQVISQAGYGEYFGHGLGHGVGLEVHESPRLSQNSSDTLSEGMVVTVEPGIYLPGKGGVRLEDLIVIQKDGYANLTGSGKTLIEI